MKTVREKVKEFFLDLYGSISILVSIFFYVFACALFAWIFFNFTNEGYTVLPTIGESYY